MIDIKIKETKKTEAGWQFNVLLIENGEDLEFEVDLDKDYYQKLSKGKIPPQDLIKKSFRFLLDREGKESILYSFNLKVIQKYFPNYESEII